MDSSFDLKLAQGLVLTQYSESNKHMKEDKTTADILVLHVVLVCSTSRQAGHKAADSRQQTADSRQQKIDNLRKQRQRRERKSRARLNRWSLGCVIAQILSGSSSTIHISLQLCKMTDARASHINAKQGTIKLGSYAVWILYSAFRCFADALCNAIHRG
jgi:predicted anti-sigma-YlaC factor YlaD